VKKGFRENVLDGFGARWAVTESTGLMDARVGCFVGPHLPRRYNHGNTARYTAKRKLLPQENYRIYQCADLHQSKSKAIDTANTDKSTTPKSDGSFKSISNRLAQLWCMVAINQVDALSTKQSDCMSHHLHQTDSDSFLIAIDNCCSRCITNSLDDFVSPPANSTTSVLGLGASVAMLNVGMVKWSILDDHGTNTDFIIPNIYYNANAPYRLFSPQHVAQEIKRIDPDQALSSTTHFDRVVLSWDNGRKTKTIRLDPFSNVALTRSSPGYQQFAMYCAQTIGNKDVLSCPAIDTTADPLDQINEIEQLDAPKTPIHPDLPNNVIHQQFDNDQNEHTNNDIDATTTLQQIFDEETDVPQSDPTSQLLAWHYRLGHLPFAKLQEMAARGNLPASLAKCTRPKCVACMFGKATQHPMADKPSKQSKPKEEFPGSVSIDHMFSSRPCLIGQMKGFLTCRQYIGACVN
jgi:GAG-pre-integrase domain